MDREEVRANHHTLSVLTDLALEAARFLHIGAAAGEETVVFLSSFRRELRILMEKNRWGFKKDATLRWGDANMANQVKRNFRKSAADDVSSGVREKRKDVMNREM